MAKKSPLHDAIKGQDVALVSELLRSEQVNLDDEVRTDAGYLMRPIHFAVEYGYGEAAMVIELLADAGADINAKSRDARSPKLKIEFSTALYHAAEINHIGAALALLGRRANPNIACNGWTPLHTASEANHIVMINLLADNGADIAARHPEYGMTPLHGAARQGATKACCLLWLLGADLNVKDAKGMTPLDLAIANGSHNSAAILRRLATPSNSSAWPVARLAEQLRDAIKTKYQSIALIEPWVRELERLEAIDFPITRNGLTVLHWLALVNWPDGVELALKCGANADALDMDQWTPLMWSVAGHNEFRNHDDAAVQRCIQLLTSNSTNLNSVDEEGLSAAMLAAREKRSTAAISLIRQGANPNCVCKRGQPFLMQVAVAGQTDLFEELLLSGANPNCQDAEGRKIEQIPNLDPKVAAIVLAWRERSELESTPLPKSDG